MARLSQFYLKLKFFSFICYLLKLSNILLQYTTPVWTPPCLAWTTAAASSCPPCLWPSGLSTLWSPRSFYRANSVTSLKPDSLRRLWRPCKRKSLPPSSVYTHCLISFPSHCTSDTPIYSLTELLSVPLISYVLVTQALRVCLMPTTLSPSAASL